MNTVEQVLKSKGSAVYSVTAQTPVYEALTVMAEHDVGTVVVLEKVKMVGIFSERDYARKVILKGKSSREITVGELMNTDVFHVSLSTRIEQCMTLMTEKRVRHLPVLDDDHLVGLISIGDVVKQIISDQEFKIHELEKYVQGGY
jgi:CBS domain-containing protein